MKKTSKLLAMSLLTALFTVGCSNDDDDSQKKTEEVGATLTASMGADLSNQVYIDLSEEKMTTVAVNSWELSFENSGNGIKTNSAKKVAVAEPSETDFSLVSTDDGLTYSYDTEDGNLTTTALSGWTANQPYIIDLGIDNNGNALGKKKFMITGTDASEISFKYADLDGSNEESKTIDLTEGNFTYFSLINNEIKTIEPTDWDFVLTGLSVRTGAPCFTLGPAAMPGINCDVYRLATSAITNAYTGVEVALDNPFENLEQNDDPESELNTKGIESSNYDTINISDFNLNGGASDADAIGSSWLQILQPHSSGTFKVYDFKTYIIKDAEGNHFKVRFLAYKGGDNAENGHPTFEYKLLSE